jgi:hypothetical protein
MSNRPKALWGIHPSKHGNDYTAPPKRPKGRFRKITPKRKHGKLIMNKPDTLTNNNAERAAGFYRLMRILLIAAVAGAVILAIKNT